ncbi:hypothetical protein PIROE2DRAFT_69637 [Piromyces sp. E2]|nr:hypothetical protein PIROE2DRAFT_69637 [Piromyces sp. E2]|eukprot:OUM61255.1 hypothetical protein PIROE2DRAFT_69637 [Piromyces sp. E2]
MSEHQIRISEDKEYTRVASDEESIELLESNAKENDESFDGTLNEIEYENAENLFKPVETVPKKSKRIYWADCARIFSMLAIIFLHSAGYGCEQRLRGKQDPNWIVVCIYNSITRFGVPMFVLLSGTFILDPSKKFSFKKLFCHNIFRLTTAFIFWSTMNAIVHIYVYENKKPEEFLKLFIVGEEYLWFIFMIIGCYLISPFLRLFSDDIVLARYFLGLCVIWGSIIPTLRNVFHVFRMNDAQTELDTWVSRWHYHFTLEFVGYFVAGYHLVKHVNVRSAFIRSILYLICFLDILFICHFTIYAEKNFKRYSKDFRETNTFTVAVYAVILFIFFKHEVGRVEFSERAIKIINKLSALTFGVYLSHMIIKGLISSYLSVNPTSFFGIPVTPTIGCPLTFLVITILSFSLSYILSITPVLKKYVL